jgi:hypothetical protein
MVFNATFNTISVISWVCGERLVNAKAVIRNSKWKEDMQYNGQRHTVQWPKTHSTMAKGKRTNNDLQNITQKTKD